jgi:hypothetical protein
MTIWTNKACWYRRCFAVQGNLKGQGQGAPDERHAKDRVGEGDIEWPGLLHEDELLDALVDEEVEQAHEFNVVRHYGALGVPLQPKTLL